jgi:ketopantoate reductase
MRAIVIGSGALGYAVQGTLAKHGQKSCQWAGGRGISRPTSPTWRA